jgi:hypothetical protein
MPKSLAELAAAVNAEQQILEQMGGGVNPFGAELAIPEGGLGFQRQYVGLIKDHDDLVVAVGDQDEIDFDTAPYPLTDLYRWLQGVVAATGERPGTLSVQVTWSASTDADGADGAYEEFE